MIVLGFTGTFAAGKDTAIYIIARKFGEKSFEISTSNLVREETTRRGLSLARENLQLVSNNMRLKHGPGVFGKLAASRIRQHAERHETEIALVSGTRTPGEIQALRREFGKNFFLIAVDAPIEIRYHRVKQRARAGEEVLSFEEFKESEEKEMQGEAHSQNIAATMKLADYKIVNNGTEKELEKKLEAILKKINARGV